MILKRIGIVALLLGLGTGVSACSEGYGYGGVDVGYGSSGYYDQGGYGYGGGYGTGYYGAGYGGLSSYYGWYGDYYYPGQGIYVYDRYRRPFRWNEGQQRYWQGRRGRYANGQVRGNWQGFNRDVRQEGREYRGDLRDNRQAYRAGTINQDQFRAGRQNARQEFRQDVHQDYHQLRQQNRAAGVATPRFGNSGARAALPRGGAGGGRGGGRGRR